MSEKAVFRVFIRGSIQDVWREITKEAEPQKCMFNMRLDTDGLKPGGQIRMRSASGKTTGTRWVAAANPASSLSGASRLCNERPQTFARHLPDTC